MALTPITNWLKRPTFTEGLELYKLYCINPDAAFLKFLSGEPNTVKLKMLVNRLQSINEKPLVEKPKELAGLNPKKAPKVPLKEIAALQRNTWVQTEKAPNTHHNDDYKIEDAPPEIQEVIKTKNKLWRQMVADREAALHCSTKEQRARYLDRIKEAYRAHESCWVEIEHFKHTGYIRNYTEHIPKKLKSFNTLQELLNTLKNYENYVHKHKKTGNSEKVTFYEEKIKALHENYNNA